MSRDSEPFDNVEVANIEARMFQLLADNEQHHDDPPSAADHKLTVLRDYQQMCGRAQALTVMSQTLESALAGRTGEAADRYRRVLEWFDRDGGQYDRGLEDAVVKVGHRINSIQAQDRSPASISDGPADANDNEAVPEAGIGSIQPEPCSICGGDGWLYNPDWREWHNVERAARNAWAAAHPDAASSDWHTSAEAQALQADHPVEPEEDQCGDCDGSGESPSMPWSRCRWRCGPRSKATSRLRPHTTSEPAKPTTAAASTRKSRRTSPPSSTEPRTTPPQPRPTRRPTSATSPAARPPTTSTRTQSRIRRAPTRP